MLLEAGATVTEATGTAVTVMVADTEATPVALLDQVTTRPVRTLFAESLVVAESCCVAPIRSVAELGATVTVGVAVPLCPSLVAVIVAEPAATAVTIPLAETVATAAALLDHVMSRPLNGLPDASRGVATSCCERPTYRLALAGDTSTDATGGSVIVTNAVSASARRDAITR